ncbi:MAG: 4-alpha-glucanotransferase [Nitrospirota bacterium]
MLRHSFAVRHSPFVIRFMNLSPEKKIGGVLVPLFALRGENDLGIGDLGALREFVDWIAEIGFTLIQLLPINETGADNSPYNAISAMAIEPTTLHLVPGSPEDLTREDFQDALTEVDLPSLRRGRVNYQRIKQLKQCILEKAFANFSARADENRRAEFKTFCEEQSSWLHDYALFRVLIEENNGSAAWNQWPPQHQSTEGAHNWIRDLPHDKQAILTRREEFFCYVQWIADQQWRNIKAHAEQRGVALMGDIPFGVSYYSADVFSRPSEFMLDWFGGAPPEPLFKDDAFTQKWGQNWGIPLYRWSVMRGNNFQWWRERVRGTRRNFHLFRIDHVQGFYRVYAFPWRPERNKEFLPLDHYQMLERTGGRAPHFIPRDDDTPENREANRREGEEYLRVVLEEAGAARVAGEDLGVVPEYVRPNLQYLGIAGFKIPQWEMRDGMIIPGEMYDRLSVATYATHDHEAVRALWDEAIEHPNSETGEQARATLEKIGLFAGLRESFGGQAGWNPQADQLDYMKDFYPAVMAALFRCNSWIAVVMVTDLLARAYRFNVPGTKANLNWTRRIQRSIAKLRSSRKECKRMQLVRELLKETARV